eukprot:Gregarina_sp_Poly_1__1202@NODE_1295_length_4465_cov_43_415643_g875_i0_p2_GENE_NODE_1295_length_4465_cov_43_415643_g875_i0NODE_1295_length_4465_cov_43_415643_g875_i0_p2_ORF_typecomplete_len251_score29_94_NODE_1295_length_4465_cov_43_415643_g875_i015002252
MTFSHSQDLNESQIRLFHRGDLSLASFSMSNVADTNFFLSATLLDAVDDSCLAKSRASGQPALGSSFALAVTGLDGSKYPVRKGRISHGGAMGILRPRATYVGLGQASNYIESLFVGAAYATQGPPTCGASEASPSNSSTGVVRGGAELQELQLPDTRGDESAWLDSFHRRWVAIIPNSELTVAPGPYRWKPKKWTLSLSVNPGKQAFAIVIGTCTCLGVVGSIILVIDQREKAALSKEHQGFKRHFVMV